MPKTVMTAGLTVCIARPDFYDRGEDHMGAPADSGRCYGFATEPKVSANAGDAPRSGAGSRGGDSPPLACGSPLGTARRVTPTPQ